MSQVLLCFDFDGPKLNIKLNMYFMTSQCLFVDR